MRIDASRLTACWASGRRAAVHTTALFSLTLLTLIGCDRSSPPSNDEPQVQTSPASSDGPVLENAATDNTLSRDAALDQAAEAMQQGRLKEARSLLTTLLLEDPTDVIVIFQLATVHAELGELERAVEVIESIEPDDPTAGLPALGQSADWCVQLERYDDAEKRYQLILKEVPDAAEAHRKLAYLYNRQGRRHEAAQHIYQLCRLGNVRQDELHALVVLSDSMSLDTDDSTAANDPNTVDYSPIGPSGLARQLFTEHRYAEAADVLRPAIKNRKVPPSVVAFYGRILAEAQLDQEFVQWLALTDESVRQYAEFWAGVAVYLGTLNDWQSASRAAMEALNRDPTDFRSINRLHLALTLLGRTEESDRWEQRWKTYKQVLTINNQVSASSPPSVDAIDELAAQLFAIDRKLEAVLWKSIESYYRQMSSDAMAHWNEQRRQLVKTGTEMPSQESRLLGMGLDTFPMPEFQAIVKNIDKDSSVASRHSAIEVATPEFANLATQVGLNHRYKLGPDDLRQGFMMYHQTGGGVAVTDFDLDGNPDLYFAQGAAAEPDFVAAESNQLYRSDGSRVVDVTVNAFASDFQYTIGCTSGDWNQDGLPDIVTSNIGTSVLMINQGDGTFLARPLAQTETVDQMPASIAMADLNSDGLADLFEVNYLRDSQISLRPEKNAAGDIIEAVGPADFAPAADRVGLNDGTGGVTLQPITDQDSATHHGLGVVIANFDGKPGNEIFVGNDKSANQYWVRDSDKSTWQDVAGLNGLAYSYDGGETASMGVAAGDFDRNGELDLHITNFQNESACLYLSRDGVFQDRANRYRLGVPSRSVLGFGSQGLDYDNNGWTDLVVTNGHIDNYLKMSGPYEQESQLFANHGDRFEKVDVVDPSGYWAQMHLGRALARVDFNRDGKQDFVVTHMSDPSAVLINQTKTDNHVVQIKLVGTRAERDAIATKVTLRSGETTQTEWLVGGDGYLCHNQPVLSFGLGTSTTVDSLTVTWPTGDEQGFSNVTVDHQLLLVEGDDDLFTLETFADDGNLN